jgi:hypothetical protein
MRAAARGGLSAAVALSGRHGDPGLRSSRGAVAQRLSAEVVSARPDFRCSIATECTAGGNRLALA